MSTEIQTRIADVPSIAEHSADPLPRPIPASRAVSAARPERRPLPYHRLARRSSRTARWWRPLAALGVALGMYLALALAVVLPLLILAVVTELSGAGWGPSQNWDDPANPFDLLLMLGIVAVMLPAAILGMRWGGGARGAIHSVLSRVRWGLMLRAAAFVVPAYALVTVTLFVVAPPADFRWPEPGVSVIAVYATLILLVPLQCAAEEYAFRGLPMQMFGTWLRSPLWGILIPVPCFMMLHGYDWVGQIDVAVFAICAGALAWKSGGLELPIVLHTANNLILFLLAPFSRSSLEQGAVDPVALLSTLPMTIGATAALWVWVSRRYSLRAFEPVTSRRLAD
ncbi:MAG: type II CAAX endopeptidase family protein [Leucobacter sp.]